MPTDPDVIGINPARSSGWLGRGGRAVWSAVKSIIRLVVETLRRTGRAIGNVVRWPICNERPLGASAIVLWLIIFTAGLVINSSAFSDALTKTVATLQLNISPITRVVNLLWGMVLLSMVLLTYTASNVAILCLLASQIGVFASRMHHAQKKGVDELPAVKSRYLAAMAGAFLIYLVVMSGSFTLLSLPISADTLRLDAALEAQKQFRQYRTLATISSIVCMIEGFQPFAIPAVNRWLRGKSGVNSTDRTTTTQIVTAAQPQPVVPAPEIPQPDQAAAA